MPPMDCRTAPIRAPDVTGHGTGNRLGGPSYESVYLTETTLTLLWYYKKLTPVQKLNAARWWTSVVYQTDGLLCVTADFLRNTESGVKIIEITGEHKTH